MDAVAASAEALTSQALVILDATRGLLTQLDALAGYLAHRPDCRPGAGCTCGLDETLRRAQLASARITGARAPALRIAMPNADQFLQTGTVMTLLHEKGYGFIKGDDGIEYFFHRSNADDFRIWRKARPCGSPPAAAPKARAPLPSRFATRRPSNE